MNEGVVPNSSSRQLMVNADSDSATTLLQHKPSRIRDSLSELTTREFLTVLVLCFVNLINYMDRFTLAGVLTFVEADFNIKDDYAGLLQTVFVIAYMVFAPIFGYLGDRYSRRMIMAFGVGLWCLTTFAGSFLKHYGAFAFFRCLVGIGEASYSTIAPTIISDLFVGNLRSKMLAFFYFAIPVGSGLGYIVGSVAGAAASDWRWGLRVTPFLGTVAVALIIWVMEDPERGQAEESQIQATSYRDDLKSLVKNPSFMLSTLAFTCVAFVTGALAWWGPQFIFLGLQLQPNSNVTMERVALVFGGVTMVSGVIGVPLGSMLGSVYIKSNPRAHPIICGIGLLLSAPALGLAIVYVESYFYLPFVLIFFGELAMNLNWSLVADMLLYVVVPPRRSTAEALQILVSHMFGDAGSPYLVGLISEWLKGNTEEAVSERVQFESLQKALFITCFVEVLGGIFFLLAAIYIVRDRNKVDKAITEAENASREPSHTVANEFKEEASTTAEEYYEPQRQIFGAS